MAIKGLDFDTVQFPRELERTEAIQAAKPDRYAPLRSIAKTLTKRGIAEAKTELVNAALLTFVETLFDVDPDGIAPNIDADGRILIPAPWGKSGGPAWGLRVSEQRALNLIMRKRAAGDVLFVYDAGARCWLVGRGYASRRLALAYLRQCPITLAEWRTAWDTIRSIWAAQKLDGQ